MLGWVSLGFVSACVWRWGCIQRTLVRSVQQGLFARFELGGQHQRIIKGKQFPWQQFVR